MKNKLESFSIRKDKDVILFRKAIWLYIFLLIFEGALRKWFLPSLATPLLVVRDPIVIWLTFKARQRGWLDNPLIILMMGAATLSLVMTLIVGHHNLVVGIFGWRIYFFHFPMIFIMGKVLTRDDVIKIGRFILLVSIPMTFLIAAQFYSPEIAWVNLGVGGEGTAGFAGVKGYMRPPGTFSFTSGYVMFQGIVGCFLFYYLVMNNTLPKKYRFPLWMLGIMTGCYLFAIPTSISRTNFFQTIVFLAFLFVAALRKDQLKDKFLKFLALGILTVIILYFFNIGATSIDAFMVRFTSANRVEGGVNGVIGNRYIGGLLGALLQLNLPFWGIGLGIGTNVGAKLMGGNMYSFGFNGEVEWGRIIGESGMFIGILIISIRLFFSLSLLKRAYNCLTRRFDLLPWMLSAGMLLNVPQGQWSIPTNLGFCVLLGGLTLAATNSIEFDED